MSSSQPPPDDSRKVAPSYDRESSSLMLEDQSTRSLAASDSDVSIESSSTSSINKRSGDLPYPSMYLGNIAAACDAANRESLNKPQRTAEEMMEARKAANRKSAKMSRDRKKNEIHELQNKVALLLRLNEALKAHNQLLSQKLVAALAAISELQEQQQGVTGASPLVSSIDNPSAATEPQKQHQEQLSPPLIGLQELMMSRHQEQQLQQHQPTADEQVQTILIPPFQQQASTSTATQSLSTDCTQVPTYHEEPIKEQQGHSDESYLLDIPEPRPLRTAPTTLEDITRGQVPAAHGILDHDTHHAIRTSFDTSSSLMESSVPAVSKQQDESMESHDPHQPTSLLAAATLSPHHSTAQPSLTTTTTGPHTSHAPDSTTTPFGSPSPQARLQGPMLSQHSPFQAGNQPLLNESALQHTPSQVLALTTETSTSRTPREHHGTDRPPPQEQAVHIELPGQQLPSLRASQQQQQHLLQNTTLMHNVQEATEESKLLDHMTSTQALWHSVLAASSSSSHHQDPRMNASSDSTTKQSSPKRPRSA